MKTPYNILKTTGKRPSKSKMKNLIQGFGTIALMIILFISGTLLLFTSVDGISSTHYIIGGFLLIIGGILSVEPSSKTKITIAVVCITLGFYCFARAADTISIPWIMRSAGLLSWIAVSIVAYVGLLSHEK